MNKVDYKTGNRDHIAKEFAANIPYIDGEFMFKIW